MENKILSVMNESKKRIGIAVLCGALTITLGASTVLASDITTVKDENGSVSSFIDVIETWEKNYTLNFNGTDVTFGFTVNSGLVTYGIVAQPSGDNTHTNVTLSLEKYTDGEWTRYDSISSGGSGNFAKFPLSNSSGAYISEGKYRIAAEVEVYDQNTNKLVTEETIISDEITYTP